MAVRCPPADEPDTTIEVGSMPWSGATAPRVASAATHSSTISSSVAAGASV